MREIIVVIPTYNAFAHLSHMLDDLFIVYHRPHNHIRFLLSDDASTDPKVSQLLQTHDFLKLPNVCLIRRPINLGFVKNVNETIKTRAPNQDVLILNTDVRFKSDFIKSIYEVFDKASNVATITPLSSNATLASVFNWPDGGDLPIEMLDGITNALSIHPSYIEIPTGVGFCMFMSCEALNELGNFSESFGLGYGEETEWCQRARKAGYRNLLALNTFVAHVGTQSFSVGQKASQQKASAKIVNRLYPEYSTLVSNHYIENCWRLYRLKLLLVALTSAQQTSNSIIQVLHADPDIAGAGGTEAHVRRSSISLSSAGATLIEVFPKRGSIKCNLYCRGVRISSDLFSFTDLKLIFAVFESVNSEIHVHHLLNWPTDAIEVIFDFPGILKIFVHDFWFITKGVNLYYNELNADGLLTTKQASLKHRSMTSSLLKKARTIICPSSDMRDWMLTFFDAPEVQSKLEVRKHSLAYLLGLVNRTGVLPSPLAKTIVFVGSLHRHKGAAEIANAVPLLEQHGFRVIIFGKIAEKTLKSAHIEIYPYLDPVELQKLFQKHRPCLAYFNSITPESFCFAFYETLLLSNCTVPIVSPIGNPAREVKEFQIGVVANGFSCTDILAAANTAWLNHATLLKNVMNWRNSFSAMSPPDWPQSTVSERRLSIDDTFLILQSNNQYKSALVLNLELKSRRVFALLDRAVEKYYGISIVLKLFLTVSGWFKSRLTRKLISRKA